MLAEPAVALERLLRRRRTLGGRLLNADMFDRWGPKEGPEFEAMQTESAAATREHAEVSAALVARSAETFARDPEAVRSWAAAHIDLLESFIATYAAEPNFSTHVFVAREESALWREVAAGTRPFVDENVYYVRVDAAQAAAYFGAPEA